MKKQHKQPQLPGLLGKLGKMTAIRETELLEQSLLKTLGPLLGILNTSLYRTDEHGAIVKVTHYHRSQTVDVDGASRVVESVEELANQTALPLEVIELTNNVRLLSKPCTRKDNGQFLIAYPLIAGNEICGHFVFQRDHEVTPVEDITIRGVLEVFSNYYALLDISQRDRLTGLLNRQALETSFDRIWSALNHPPHLNEKTAGRRSHAPTAYWMAVIDVDYFKKVNDEYGHIVGDEVLLLIGRLLTQTFRTTDLLYRYGGEEFVAIVAAENEEIARQIFERVRETVAQFFFPRVERMTISIGYCLADPKVLPLEVLGHADQSLYEAKNQGRNRVCEYSELVSKGCLKAMPHGESELF